MDINRHATSVDSHHCGAAAKRQRQIGRKRYQPELEMVHKLRDVMAKRDGHYPLQGDMEIDEGFFFVAIILVI